MLNILGTPEECTNCGTFIEELMDNQYLCQDCYEIKEQE